jgi:UDP-N-acetylglucosamine:LPS N-acetylglucosamine transferase
MITQLQDCKKKVLLVRGLPKGKVPMKLNHPNVEVCDHLGEQELNQKILQSQYVVCRSGYSTLMDLYILRKSATIIPTPSQSEQEYLAKHLDGKYGFTSIEQEQLNLKDLLDQIH